MDGIKLDERYREKNGLGSADPIPERKSKKPANKRFTFDAPVNEIKKSPKTVAKPMDKKTFTEENSVEVGFIDKVISEEEVIKNKKSKQPKFSESNRKLKKSKPPKNSKSSTQPKPKKQLTPTNKHQEKPIMKSSTSTSPKKVKSSKKNSLSSRFILIGKVAIVMAIVAFSIYNFLEVQRLNDLLEAEIGQQSQNEIKNQELIDKISSFRLLPDSEYEIYTVKDKSKLVNDPVFERAENGDKVIVYSDDSLTIVYRESEGKIIGESKNSSLTEKE
jgi:hypothetical protein